MKAFITGSRAYGTPREDSDVDLVVLMSHDAMAELAKHGKPGWNPANVSCNLRFGNLNLIAMDSERLFDIWESVTAKLIERKPVTRAEAVREFGAEIGRMYGAQG